jgi:ABC-2 type transport system ATP-binding protein
MQGRGLSVIAKSAVVQVSNLVKCYGKTKAVDSVSFDVKPGEIFGLLGPNGSGKSSALHCITGILPFDAGNIHIRGVRHDTPEAKMSLGFVADDLSLPISLTGAEFLRFCEKMQPRTDLEWRSFLVDELSLTAHLGKFMAEYSHGMKRKIQLISALAHMPRLLILDEPYRGLDPEASVLLRELVATFAQRGGAVLVATHDLLAAEAYFDCVCIMSAGASVALGEPRQLSEASNCATLEQLFLQVVGLEESTLLSRDRIASHWPAQEFAIRSEVN